MAEWIPQLTAELSIDELRECPSALNPFPERIEAGDYMVSDEFCMPTRASNHHVHVDYGDGKLIRAQIPLRPVQPEDMTPPKDAQERASYDKRWQEPEDTWQFSSIVEVFDRQAPTIARRWLIERDKQAIQALGGLLVVSDQYDSDVFMKQELVRHRTLTADGNTGAALALTQALRRGMTTVDGQRRQLWGCQRFQHYDTVKALAPGLLKDPEVWLPNSTEGERLAFKSLKDKAARQISEIIFSELDCEAIATADGDGVVEVRQKISLLATSLSERRAQLVTGFHRLAEQMPEFVHQRTAANLKAITSTEVKDALVFYLHREKPHY